LSCTYIKYFHKKLLAIARIVQYHLPQLLK
jgi:hypothetical protein